MISRSLQLSGPHAWLAFCFISLFCGSRLHFFAGASLYAILFSVIHNYSHKNPEWTKKWIPWHYDHHMKYQNDNMNVVLPIFDYIMGTRKKFLDKSL